MRWKEGRKEGYWLGFGKKSRGVGDLEGRVEMEMKEYALDCRSMGHRRSWQS